MKGYFSIALLILIIVLMVLNYGADQRRSDFENVVRAEHAKMELMFIEHAKKMEQLNKREAVTE